MKQRLFLLLLLINSSFLFGQKATHESLIYVTQGEKKGFINFEGEIIIPVEFDAKLWFSENLIPLNKGAIQVDYTPLGGKWGFWNDEGQEVIPLTYDDAKIFREGLAPVKLKGKYGFIDIHNQVQIDFQFDDANPFQEGLAAIKIDNKWGFIDKSGEFIIPPSYHRAQDFQEGFSIVFNLRYSYEFEEDGETYIDEIGTYGLMNKKGDLIIDTVYNYIEPFKNGFAKIELDQKQGFINTKGEIAIPLQYDRVESFSEGLAVVANYRMRDSYHDFGYTQKQFDSLKHEMETLEKEFADDLNQVLNHPTYDAFFQANMQQASEELMHGYINEKGEQVIDFQFDEADAFKNGLAKVRIGPTLGITPIYQDEQGQIMPSYGEQKGLGSNLIDRQGHLQLEKNQQIINRYADAYFVSYNYSGAGAQSENMKVVIPHQYQNLRYIGSGYFLGEIRDSQKKVLIGHGIKTELDENFWDAKSANGNRILVDYIVKREKNHKTFKSGIINEKGEWILKPIYDFAYSKSFFFD